MRLARTDANSAHVTIVAAGMGRVLGRIGDHTGIVGERLRDLLTGDHAHLASEVR